MKNRIKLLLYLFLSSLNFNLILKKYGLITGGTQAIAIIVSTVINVSPWILILIINSLFFIISFFLLDRETSRGIIITTFVYPLFVKITSGIWINISNSMLLLVLISGIISGITMGNILKMNYSTGGINILILLLHYIIGYILFFCNKSILGNNNNCYK